MNQFRIAKFEFRNSSRRSQRLRGEISEFLFTPGSERTDRLLSPRQDAKNAKRQAQGLSFRANARDLGKISLGACPELCRRVRNDNALPLQPLRDSVPSHSLRTSFAQNIFLRDLRAFVVKTLSASLVAA